MIDLCMCDIQAHHKISILNTPSPLLYDKLTMLVRVESFSTFNVRSGYHLMRGCMKWWSCCLAGLIPMQPVHICGHESSVESWNASLENIWWYTSIRAATHEGFGKLEPDTSTYLNQSSTSPLKLSPTQI